MDDYNKQPGQSYGETHASGATGTAARMKEQISEKASDVKETVTDLGRRTADKIDQSRSSAAVTRSDGPLPCLPSGWSLSTW